MSLEGMLSINVGILSALVMMLLGWQIYNAITAERRIRKLVESSEKRILDILDSRVCGVRGELQFYGGQDYFNLHQYYPAFCRFLESLNLYSVARNAGGVALSQWFILRSIKDGDLKLSDEDKLKLKESLKVCYRDSGLTDYREEIMKLLL